MNTNIISKYLQLLRKKHNFTQDELAKRLDISRQAVSKWETGAAIPDLEVLLKISKLYGITINDILEPNIPTKKITDFEQLSRVPENELRDILEQYDMTSLVIASMGASPEINNLLEKLFPDVDFSLYSDEGIAVFFQYEKNTNDFDSYLQALMKLKEYNRK